MSSSSLLIFLCVCVCVFGYWTESPTGCQPTTCHRYAHCRQKYDSWLKLYVLGCTCRKGFSGDGLHHCTRDPPTCVGACGRNANCKVLRDTVACACPRGYTGNPSIYCRNMMMMGGGSD